MKLSSFYILFLSLILSSTGCEKQNLGGLDPGSGEIIQFYIPNVFILNNQENNLFYPKVISDNPDAEFIVELMEIFDSYGNPIFKGEQFPTNDSSFGWDGSSNGEPVESGSYSYSIRIGDGIGSRLFIGDVTVLK